jgi:hypothetical protein
MNGSMTQIERCLDNLRDPDTQLVFIEWMKDKREDLLEELISKGGDGPRFKVQMLDEVIGFEEELSDFWKAKKESA